MLHVLFSLLCLKYIFFWFYQSVRFEAKERFRTCKDYVIGGEINTVLKIAVDTITLELCDSRDYFANSLLKRNVPIKFNRDFEERKLLFIALVLFVSFMPTYLKKLHIKTITSSKISQHLQFMVQSAARGKQFVCSRQSVLCYRLISWLHAYSHQWFNKDCLQPQNLKVDVRVIIFSLLCVKYIFLALPKRWIQRE